MKREQEPAEEDQAGGARSRVDPMVLVVCCGILAVAISGVKVVFNTTMPADPGASKTGGRAASETSPPPGFAFAPPQEEPPQQQRQQPEPQQPASAPSTTARQAESEDSAAGKRALNFFDPDREALYWWGEIPHEPRTRWSAPRLLCREDHWFQIRAFDLYNNDVRPARRAPSTRSCKIRSARQNPD